MTTVSLETSLHKTILVCRQDYAETSPNFKQFQEIETELSLHNIKQITALSLADASVYIHSDPAIQCLVIDWNIGNGQEHDAITELLVRTRSSNRNLPVFLAVEHGSTPRLCRSALQSADGFIVLPEDTSTFIAGRISRAITAYRQSVLPPMFKALVSYAADYEYSWHIPGHTGGTAFLKSPVGQAFFNFFGEQVFRSDLCDAVTSVGSLLSHAGPIGEGERYAARVFGADRTYYVTGGTSGSNRMVITATLTEGDLALCDRNCHKSVEHAMRLSGAVPVYLMPSRNHYGMIGPVPAGSLGKQHIQALVKNHRLVDDTHEELPRYAVITNSTYDGLCYNVRRVISLLDATVDRVHFDEAWYSYARFHRLYEDRHAMFGDPAAYNRGGPSIFATQSTHKLLAAFAQASMIHVRDGRAAIEHQRFNEAYTIHSTTSPSYPMLASNDVSAAMMDGPQGEHLLGESIEEAVRFRQMIGRIRAAYQSDGDWFFSVFQPDQVIDADGRAVPFHEADPDYLAGTPSCWLLGSGDAWHGFGDLEENYCLLDPIKVNITTPGVNTEGSLAATGIPACILERYLFNRKIVVEKIADYSVLVLFSLGITRGKWGTLVNALLNFKTDYDSNRPVAEVLPAHIFQQSVRYEGMGLKDLCDEMFATMKALGKTALTSSAFSSLPQADMTPAASHRKFVQGMVEQVPLSRLAGRTLAVAVLLYPPGIPLLMPGENAGPEDGSIMRYLHAMQAFDNRFPGFEHNIQGLERINSEYHFQCIT